MTDSSKTGGKTTAEDTPDTRSERQETFRRESFGGRRMRLAVPESAKDPKYWYYWFRDSGDNLYQAQRAGYEFVTFRDAKRNVPVTINEADKGLKPEDVCQAHGGAGEGGIPYKMVLMRLPMELRLEDEAAHAAAADEIDRAIYRPEFKDGKVVGNQLQYGSFDVQLKDKE